MGTRLPFSAGSTLGLLALYMTIIPLSVERREQYSWKNLPALAGALLVAQGTRAGAIALALGSLSMMGIGGALAFTPVNAIMVRAHGGAGRPLCGSEL